MECSLRGKKERPSFSCETFLSLFSRLFKFTLFPNTNHINHQLASEPNRTKPKRNHSKGYISTTPFLSPPLKKRPHQPLPSSLIKTEKVIILHPPSPIPQITFPLPKKKKTKEKEKFTTSTAPADSSSHPPAVHTPDTPANSSIRASRPMR